jgi:hypothetical protein
MNAGNQPQKMREISGHDLRVLGLRSYGHILHEVGHIRKKVFSLPE